MSRISSIPAITSHGVPLPTTVAGAAGISAAHIGLPVPGPAVPIVLFQHLDLVDVLDGVGQLVGGLQVPGRHLRLAGDLLQLFAELFFQLMHIHS